MPVFANMQRLVLTTFFAITPPAAPALSADLSCNGLVPEGQSMICSGFEPNWAIQLSCESGAMQSNFIDAFSGAEITETPGTVTFSSESPWTFETSHPVKGSIAYTPAGCQDESDRTFDFTFTPESAPGLDGPFYAFCCRMVE
jgi:hypothetical protein